MSPDRRSEQSDAPDVGGGSRGLENEGGSSCASVPNPELLWALCSACNERSEVGWTYSDRVHDAYVPQLGARAETVHDRVADPEVLRSLADR